MGNLEKWWEARPTSGEAAAVFKMRGMVVKWRGQEAKLRGMEGVDR